MSHPLQVLLVRQQTTDESLRLARLLAYSDAGPTVMPVVGQLFRSVITSRPCYNTPIDNVVVVHRAAPRPDGEPVTLASLADTDMVLVGLYGTARGDGDNRGTFSARPTAGRTEAETNEAVRLALAAIKAEMPSHLDPETSFIMYAGCPTPILDYIIKEMPLLWGDHFYDMYSSDKAPTQFGVHMGSSWVDEQTGETFFVDRIRVSDIDYMLAEKTVDYDFDYLEFITQTYPFTELNCMIRAFPKGVDPPTASHEQGEPASWVSTHQDFSIALLATRDKFRRRKLAAKCVEVVSRLQLEFMRKHGLDVFGPNILSFGFVKDGNVASIRTMEGCGFIKVKEPRFMWIGIKLASIPSVE
ncbi:hypothetical protein HK105_203987 [Polyrhizophydium stewartii]|uniref:N-acetyltransferase domain-containing protein n=1 Tax=Polyrhizophydium stewartii TaxID=2732419 RepID=A0ABR4NAL7_9FUNG|nr:hypothetical protein HK105_001348 [Polyrhizophydium stewartii]